jgi:type 1 fimbria pilin
MVLGSTTARAAEGRIEFSGAVLAPTCAASVARIDALLALQDNGSAQIACQGAGAGTPAAPTTYSLTVSSIDTKSAGNNQLLTYFLGYAHAAGKAGTQPALVTQVFS